MKDTFRRISSRIGSYFTKRGWSMRSKLIAIFLLVKVVPLLLITLLAWNQIVSLGSTLRTIAVKDSSVALNQSAVENIERMTTDTAGSVARFLYARDDDIRYLASLEPTPENYARFLQSKQGMLMRAEPWSLAEDNKSWIPSKRPDASPVGGQSTNAENDDMDGFHYRNPDAFSYTSVPLYDEITFVDLQGNELVKVIAEGSTKKNYPLNPAKRNVSLRENTYVKAETYFAELQGLRPNEIYVSDVTGAYVGSNYIGMYAPSVVAAAAADRGYDIPYTPEQQAYAGAENPNGQRFEGIVRWATPVADAQGAVIGYVTFALNHDHIMEFVDHLTPMNDRYTELPSAFGGNYAFIWDYKCRSICHPRHHSIVGFDPATGDPQVPWLETSIYEAWQASGVAKWSDFIAQSNWPLFDAQSRTKKPAPVLTKAGLVGLDGRYLNNAPQCTGWMDLTEHGGSGSFYILWSGLYKLTTAAAIPYYTGHYAPSEANDFSKRGFGFVAIGAGLEDFTRPATQTEEKLGTAIGSNLRATFLTLLVSTAVLIALVVLIAIWMASSLTGNITRLIKGISRFRKGERQFRFHSEVKDEFGTLADSFDEMADSIVDSVKNPLCITDTERRIVYMNEPGLTLDNATLEQLVGQPYGAHSIYPAGTRFDPILALIEGREADIYYIEGRNRYIQGIANYFLSKSGERTGYIIETRDVTEMVREQLQIAEQRTLLDKIFSASPDMIWYLGAQGEYLAVNPRFASIVGQAPEAFVGKTMLEMLPGAAFAGFIKNDQDALATGVTLYTEERILFADGRDEVLDAVRTPILDASGALVGVLGFARNVDTRVAIEAQLRSTQLELEKAVQTANRANEHKGDFLARMSHEIRTPMNAIIGVTNIVQKKLDAVPQAEAGNGWVDIREHMEQIETSSQHLLGLLNDILDISKIEAGKIELSDEVVALSKLESTVVGIIKPRCDEKHIRFETFFDHSSPSSVVCDSLRLRQVLINLLGNAVKFTPEGGCITLRVEKKDQHDGQALFDFSVQDTGIGISEGALSTIFEPFEQGDRKVSRQFGGTGLGLTISRSIVQMFGGDISIQSKPGQGSTFSFSIWLRTAETDLPAEASTTDISGKFTGKHILLVDDVDINRMIVSAMLESSGLTIDEANDGTTAVELFRQSPEGTYDLILMDVQMPEMDGYEATAAIRAMPRADARRVPIIALTANAFKEDIKKALAHGMNAHIAKPVEMEALAEALFRYLG